MTDAITPRQERQRKSLVGKVFDSLNRTLESNRGGGRSLEATLMAEEAEQVAEVATRRARNAGSRRVVIPDGVRITGSIVGSADAEIGGTVEGDLAADGAVWVLKTGTVGGKINARSVRVDGSARGTVHAAGDVLVGGSGSVSAPIQAGGTVEVSGTVEGDITTPGRVRILKTGRVNGNLKMHVLYMEDGGTLNGQCAMGVQRRAPETEQKGA